MESATILRPPEKRVNFDLILKYIYIQSTLPLWHIGESFEEGKVSLKILNKLGTFQNNP